MLSIVSLNHVRDSANPLAKRRAANSRPFDDTADIVRGFRLDDAVAYREFRQNPASIVKAKVARPTQKHRPSRHPSPESFVRMTLEPPRQIIGFVDKEGRQHFRARHDAKKLCMVAKLRHVIRRGRRCAAQSIGDEL